MKPACQSRVAFPLNEVLARVLGCRYSVDTRGVTMPPADWRLYDRTLNPRSAVTVRWLQHAGNSHLWIGGIDTYSDEPWEYLSRLAEAAPDMTHLAVWRDRFEPEYRRRDVGVTPQRD